MHKNSDRRTMRTVSSLSGSGDLPSLSDLEMSQEFGGKAKRIPSSLEEDEAVMALAATLAPAMEELDDLLSDSKYMGKLYRTNSKTRMEESASSDDVSIISDNSMSLELNRLAESERMLRKELEGDINLGSLFPKLRTDEDDDDDDENETGKELGSDSHLGSLFAKPTIDKDGNENETRKQTGDDNNLGPLFPKLKTEKDQDDDGDDDDEDETQGTEPPESENSSALGDIKRNLLDDAKEDDFDDIVRFEDEDEREDEDDDMPPDETLNSVSLGGADDTIKENPITCHSYTLADHSHHLRMQSEARGGWHHIRVVPIDVREYIVPVPDKELQQLYIGLNPFEDSGPSAVTESSKSSQPMQTFESLPLRSIMMKLRPDVLVGSIMDVLVGTLSWLDVKKQQKGHVFLRDPLGLRVDCQVVTYKGSGGRFSERFLLMRVYYKKEADDDEPPPELGQEFDQAANLKLKEAAALVQKMETSKRGGSEGFFGSSFLSEQQVYPNQRAMQKDISKQLLKKYKPCPSVQEGHLTLPALSEADWPWVQYSWKYIDPVWSALRERNWTCSTLKASPFGRAPNLPTLDSHYCAQLKRMCRENMIVSLLKSASELEQYAREAEYICASLIQTLKPCFENYQIEPPSPPAPLPLTAYPLDFKSPQNICHPWGPKVKEALEQIIKFESRESNSIQNSKKAVQMVISAFEWQDDEEQSARLGRKNDQVMDRLAKMQAHKRACIEALAQAREKSPKARKAADDFQEFAKKHGSEVEPSHEVPLFKSHILVGRGVGACFVTASQIMCVSSRIPIIGGNRFTLLELDGLVFKVHEPSSGLLSHLPSVLSIHLTKRMGGQEIFSFRPTCGARRLKSLLEILQGVEKRKGNEYSAAGSLSQLDIQGDSKLGEICSMQEELQDVSD